MSILKLWRSQFICGLACSVFFACSFPLFSDWKTGLYLKWEVVISFSGLKFWRLHVRRFEDKL